MPPIVPVPVDPVREAEASRQAAKRQALRELEALEVQQLHLSRPVLFVPGWAGEEGMCWMAPYDGLLTGHAPAKAWVERIVSQADRRQFVRFLTFSLAESKASESFLEFATLLKAKIRAAVPSGSPIDLVCHSMGSLDAIAAITQPPDPLDGVTNLVAVASPLQGIVYGKLVKPIDELLPFLRWEPHHYVQVANMNAEAPAMRVITTLEARRRLLARIGALHEIEGTQDMVVMRSARLRRDGLSPTALGKITHRAVDGAMHTGPAGVTQDPRTVWQILRILGGMS